MSYRRLQCYGPENDKTGTRESRTQWETSFLFSIATWPSFAPCIIIELYHLYRVDNYVQIIMNEKGKRLLEVGIKHESIISHTNEKMNRIEGIESRLVSRFVSRRLVVVQDAIASRHHAIRVGIGCQMLQS
jgi:hypothetical protein